MDFTLVTPSCEIASFTARYVRVPGIDGQFGVLQGHMPLIATLQPDAVLKAEAVNGDVHQYRIGQGFADVMGTRVTVLAETAEKTS